MVTKHEDGYRMDKTVDANKRNKYKKEFEEQKKQKVKVESYRTTNISQR